MTGFHPLDGARHLRDAKHADDLLCRLVAHHTCAINEAAERGLADDLLSEFTPPPDHPADALIYADMTASPDGQAVTIDQRITEIIARYGPDHLVSRAITRSAPQMTAAADRANSLLANLAAASGTRTAAPTSNLMRRQRRAGGREADIGWEKAAAPKALAGNDG